ncbi:unnamed protein product [Trichobilharzia szidati]|nr:unnamed protein product [Trichobilharzia szidati]
MLHKLEDVKAKNNRLAEEAVSEDRIPDEHREDGGDEDNQPTATTTATNHHQLERFDRGYFLHLSDQETRFQPQVTARMKMSKPARIGKVRYTFINLKPV